MQSLLTQLLAFQPLHKSCIEDGRRRGRVLVVVQSPVGIQLLGEPQSALNNEEAGAGAEPARKSGSYNWFLGARHHSPWKLSHKLG